MTRARPIRVAVVHGPGQPCHDGVSDYVAHLVAALGAVRVAATGVAVRPRTPRRWLAATVAAGHQVRRLRPDVVHVQFAPSAYGFSGLPGLLLPRLLPPATPLVTTVHEYGWWAAPGWLPAPLWRALEATRLWDRETGRLVPASSTVVVTNAAHGTQVHRRTGRYPTEIPLAPNVVTRTVFPHERRTVRRRLRLTPSAFLLVFFGFVHPVKGLRYAVQALPALRAAHPGVHLAVVGGFTSQALPPVQAAAFRSELHAMADRCGVADAITFTGHLPPDDVSGLLAAADAAVLPFTAGVTLKSGALLSTLAHGVPTAVTVADEPDPQLRDGETVAVIAARRDSAAVTATVRRLITDGMLRRRLAAGGRALVTDRTWARVALAHRQLYERVTGHG